MMRSLVELKIAVASATEAQSYFNVIHRTHWSVPDWIDETRHEVGRQFKGSIGVGKAWLQSYHHMRRWNAGLLAMEKGLTECTSDRIICSRGRAQGSDEMHQEGMLAEGNKLHGDLPGPQCGCSVSAIDEHDSKLVPYELKQKNPKHPCIRMFLGGVWLERNPKWTPAGEAKKCLLDGRQHSYRGSTSPFIPHFHSKEVFVELFREKDRELEQKRKQTNACLKRS
ncbi:hypothetical protein F5Y15DRAFT_101512 [Xylariaceae sp. FL0016]|nr:hypothetical protein F5Y15DRAFT_101512 [Xylariaceae sp. FL0016]